MNKPIRCFLYILLILLLCLLFYLLRSFFYNNLIYPITHIFWLIARTFLSINQEVLWTILLLIVSFVVLLIFPKDQQYGIKSSYLYLNKTEDRFTYWKLKLQSAEKNSYARDSLQHNLEELATSVEDLIGKNMEGDVSMPKLKTKPQVFLGIPLPRLFIRKSPNGNKFSDKKFERNLNHFLDSLESLMEK